MTNKQNLGLKGRENEELQGDYIADAEELTTPTVVEDSPQPIVVTGGHEAINQFFERPIIRPDGARQPIHYKAVGHLLSNGIDPENIQAATLIHTITLSARWGYPISAMIVSEEPEVGRAVSGSMPEAGSQGRHHRIQGSQARPSLLQRWGTAQRQMHYMCGTKRFQQSRHRSRFDLDAWLHSPAGA